MGNSAKRKYITSIKENFEHLSTEFLTKNKSYHKQSENTKKVNRVQLKDIKNNSLIEFSLDLLSKLKTKDKHINNISLINSIAVQRVKNDNEFIYELTYIDELYKENRIVIDNNISSTKLAKLSKLSLSKISNVHYDNDNDNNIETTSMNKIFDTNPSEGPKATRSNFGKKFTMKEKHRRLNTETYNKNKTLYSTTISTMNKSKQKKCQKYFPLPKEEETKKNKTAKPKINQYKIRNQKIKVDLREFTDSNSSSNSTSLNNKPKSIITNPPVVNRRRTLVKASSKTITIENVSSHINKIKKRYSIYPIKTNFALIGRRKDKEESINDQKILNQLLKMLEFPKKEVNMQTIEQLDNYDDYHKALTDFRKNNTFLFEITKEEQKINELISKGDCYNTICNCNNNSVTNDNTFIIKN